MFRMEGEAARKLALDLLHSDNETDVEKILRTAGLWADSAYWRLVGDDENNFKTIGNQQARPESALVEKLVNSMDARLLDACRCAGIDPEGRDAPQSISEARTRFFSGVELTELARGITLAITGSRVEQTGMPCITICDTGEGQSPKSVPDTFMSIDKKNKLRIPFVQGKFNMGGTGALMFCGTKRLQLLITRRNPELVPKADSHARQWSITIVRRESPPEGPGQVRNSYFKYLAPFGSDERHGHGDLLTFDADELAIMPERDAPYARPMRWGSCIKLYNYDMRGFKGHIIRTGGLLPRLEVLLPEVALPVRLHECRKGFGGKAASYDTNLLGLRQRLEASKSDALEPGYPDSLTLRVKGEPMIARVYAFKGENADRYRSDQGVVFTINGQTHGWIPKSIFERKRVKMGRLAKSILIIVDCTNISVQTREDLFKNSRDRLSGAEIRKDIESELEDQIANHVGLRELRERRQREDVAERIQNAKPLEDILREILRRSPSLSRLLLFGQRLNRPFKEGGEESNAGGSGAEGTKGDFKGRAHPTYFRFEKRKDGEMLTRTAELERRCRFRFATDVENEYFARESNAGRFQVEVIEGSLEGSELTTSVSLHNGVANWNVAFPSEDLAPGETLTLQFTIKDDTLLSPFVNVAKVTLVPVINRPPGSVGAKKERSGGNAQGSGGPGSGSASSSEGGESDRQGLDIPTPLKVRKNSWSEHGFNEFSACTIIDDGVSGESAGRSSYKFYVNVDNLYLLTDIKHGKADAALVETKFLFGNVLVALALLHEENSRKTNHSDTDSNADAQGNQEETSVRERIERTTRALAPFLIPMIDHLGGLQPSDVSQLAQAGDEE